jgi:hypothetical protein
MKRPRPIRHARIKSDLTYCTRRIVPRMVIVPTPAEATCQECRDVGELLAEMIARGEAVML